MRRRDLARIVRTAESRYADLCEQTSCRAMPENRCKFVVRRELRIAAAQARSALAKKPAHNVPAPPAAEAPAGPPAVTD